MAVRWSCGCCCCSGAILGTSGLGANLTIGNVVAVVRREMRAVCRRENEEARTRMLEGGFKYSQVCNG